MAVVINVNGEPDVPSQVSLGIKQEQKCLLFLKALCILFILFGYASAIVNVVDWEEMDSEERMYFSFCLGHVIANTLIFLSVQFTSDELYPLKAMFYESHKTVNPEKKPSKIRRCFEYMISLVVLLSLMAQLVYFLWQIYALLEVRDAEERMFLQYYYFIITFVINVIIGFWYFLQCFCGVCCN